MSQKMVNLEIAVEAAEEASTIIKKLPGFSATTALRASLHGYMVTGSVYSWMLYAATNATDILVIRSILPRQLLMIIEEIPGFKQSDQVPIAGIDGSISLVAGQLSQFPGIVRPDVQAYLRIWPSNELHHNAP